MFSPAIRYGLHQRGGAAEWWAHAEFLTEESKQGAASTAPTSEEDLCPICYAHSISAIFKPCSHKSCKACINQHLMNKKDCFFCKATITGVEDYSKPASS
ncbi:hypothetical protein OJAV_G00236930 [Oryzias javanicus]|uniref:RING-type E3 ubiquitin transferase n=1 Tax=Oryzias javanicus TaxID=123683 RepID=A0A437BYW2_ORYJA|nr:hypothetical protein OJAV_G00236930 [Oryzias javanicus]